MRTHEFRSFIFSSLLQHEQIPVAREAPEVAILDQLSRAKPHRSDQGAGRQEIKENPCHGTIEHVPKCPGCGTGQRKGIYAEQGG